MNISLDSNAWEKIFDVGNTKYANLRAAFRDKTCAGFICETTFRIEAISKLDRRQYFGKPKMDVRSGVKAMPDGSIAMSFSIGPDDDQHPGLPVQQDPKLKSAFSHNIKLMHGIAWMGLPRPNEHEMHDHYVIETAEERSVRDQCRANLMHDFRQRNVGRSAFEDIGGWTEIEDRTSDKKFAQACAEWADGELVMAHIAYKNDLLCTDDMARNSSQSIFDIESREWLSNEHNVIFITTDELLNAL